MLSVVTQHTWPQWTGTAVRYCMCPCCLPVSSRWHLSLLLLGDWWVEGSGGVIDTSMPRHQALAGM